MLLSKNDISLSLQHYFSTQPNVPTSESDLFALIVDINFVLLNPEITGKYLAELNDKIAQRITAPLPDATSIRYNKMLDTQLPAYSIAHCHYNEGATALAALLLMQEQKHGVNFKLATDTIPLFTGNVPHPIANQLVEDGYLWEENNDDACSFLHGVSSHRIQFYLITRAIDDGLITSPLTTKPPLFGHLTRNSHLLRFKLDHSMNYKFNLWHLCLDNNYYSYAKMQLPLMSVIQKHPDKKLILTAPVNLNSYLLSALAFTKLSYLAFGLLATQYRGVVVVAKAIDRDVTDVSQFFISQLHEQALDPRVTSLFLNYRKASGSNEHPQWNILHTPPVAQKTIAPVIKPGFFAKTSAVSTNIIDGSRQVAYLNKLCNVQFTTQKNGTKIDATTQFNTDVDMQVTIEKLKQYHLPFVYNNLNLIIPDITSLNKALKIAYDVMSASGSTASQPNNP